MENFLIIVSKVMPVFIIVIVGYLLKTTKIMNDNFISISSKIVFNVALPALIFMELSALDIKNTFKLDQLLYIYGATIISFIISWIAADIFVEGGKNKGAFIQGSFRGNFAIFGLALVSSVFGDDSLGKASLLLAFIIPIYNVLSVIALTVPMHEEKKLDIKKTFFEIVKNPLIMAVIVALPFSYFQIPVSIMFLKTGEYLSSLTLPLALIGIGGSLNIENIKSASRYAFIATVIKMLIIPALLTYGAYLFGFANSDVVIMFLLFACPTAIASFIMAEAMGSNGKLAGNIVLLTTLISVVTISLGLYILKSVNFF